MTSPADPELAELRAALERVVAERDAARGSLSFMAHEMRSPLAALLGIGALLRDTQLGPSQRELLAIMERGAAGLVDLINNVLDMSKLEAGKLELDSRPFEFRTCLEECLDLVSGSAMQKGLELGYSVDEATPVKLLGDGGRLRQVLINLISNGIKFTKTGHIIVEAATQRLPDGRLETRVTVSDTGPGIPPDRLEAVFGEFIQADSSTASRHGGSGLGLSICRRLVSMMGGRIWAESDGQFGTKVHFTIVARSADTADVALPGRHPIFVGRRVLVVHDDLALGALLTRQLGRWGIQAEQATQPSQAVDRLGTGERYDLALINNRVVGRDGRAVGSAIRAAPGGETLPMVLLTALGAEGGESTGGAADDRARFLAYLAKPVKRGRLHELLMSNFSRAAPEPSVRVADSIELRPSEATLGDSAQVEHPKATSPLAGARILIADDDPLVLALLEEMMQDAGTEVLAVADGRAVVEAFDRFAPDLVLLDGAMPELDGFAVCRQLKASAETRLIPVVLVTALQSREDRLRGVEAGADSILTKPISRLELLARVRALVELKRFTDGFEQAESVLLSMARCVEGRDPDTHGHCERLSGFGSRLAERLGLDRATVDAVRLGGVVHDLGKVAVPDAVLLKAGPLNEEEWAEMRRHPIEGERICSGLRSFRNVLPIIRHHHERLDGSGYPDGLAGDAIPIGARVLQIVDIFDALTTTRPYRTALAPGRALEIIRSEADRGWRDSRITDAFTSMVLEGDGLAALST
ncbi:MAG: HD domain-containing phosphohydrolase [Gemmatimonadales bacterium]